MNFLSGQDEFRRGQDDFFRTANQPIICLSHIIKLDLSCVSKDYIAWFYWLYSGIEHSIHSMILNSILVYILLYIYIYYMYMKYGMK